MKRYTTICILIALSLLLIILGCETVGLSRGTTTAKATKSVPSSGNGVEFKYEAPNAQNVSVVGEFNKWDVNANPMKNDGGVWKLTLPLDPGTYQYKFLVNGTDWKTDPSNNTLADDGYGGKNSVITVGGKPAETTPPAVKAVVVNKGGTEFTFNAPDAKSVNLVGDFNKWDTNANPMNKMGSNWKLTLPLAEGSYQYKFLVNGTDWKQDPNNSKTADDGYGGKNSLIEVGTLPATESTTTKSQPEQIVSQKDTTKKASAEKAITKKETAKEEQPVTVNNTVAPPSSDTFPVKFEYKPLTGGTHTVFLAGDFNSWSVSATPMTEKNGNYETTLNLKKGKYGYKFYVDGNWLTDDNAKDFADDGYGGQNAIVFAGAPADINTLRKVTFTYQPKGNEQTVYLVGSFNNWSQTANKMEKQKDGSYQTTLLLKPDSYTYKFIANGTDWITDPNAKSFVDDGFGGKNSVLEVDESFSKVTIAPGDGEILTYGISNDQSLENINPLSENQIEFKTKAHMNDVQNIDVVINDITHSMKMIGDDGTFSYYRYVYNLKSNNEQLRYYYVYHDGNSNKYLERLVFGNDFDKTLLFEYPSSSIQPFYTPDWAKNGIIYQIFPDRFANGNTSNDPDFHEWYYQGINIPPKPGTLLPPFQPYYHMVKDWYDISGLTKSPYHQGNQPDYNSFYGGDITGVDNNLNYLKDLGVTIIYFNPINQAKSNHRYDAEDYKTIDPHFGTEAEFQKFVKDAHAAGIKVILDVAYNHTGETHWAFQDGLKKGPTSPYYKWYEWKKWPMPQPLPAGDKPINYYDCWWGFGEMPDLNYDLKHSNSEENSFKDTTNVEPNTPVVNYVVSTADYWLGKMDIDGFRLDVPNEVPFWFWEKFRTRVKTIKPDAYLVGEIWTNASDWVNNKYFDSVMNYAYFRDPVQRFIIDRKTTAKKFDQEMKPGVMNYPVQASEVMMNLIDSHDTYRFLESAKGDVSKLKLAAFLQMTWMGTPNIWYGDEIGTMGGKDPDCRRPFNWKYTENTDAVQLHDYYKRLISIRKMYPALRTGTITPLVTDGMVYGFLRNLDNENIIVILNNDTKNTSVEVPVSLPNGTWYDEMTATSFQLKNGIMMIPVTAMSGAILVQKTGKVSTIEKVEIPKQVQVAPKETRVKAVPIEKKIQKTPISVSKMEESHSDNVYFNSGSVQLNEDAIKVLKVFISKIKDADILFKIQLIGHTDNQKIIGNLAKTYPTNWDLSVARCTAVASYLINKGKIDPKLISITGKADTEPIVETKGVNNRRVELLIVQ